MSVFLNIATNVFQAGAGGFMKNPLSARRNGFIKIQMFFSGGKNNKLSAKQAIM
jgi:hypothetical protein